MTIKKKYYEIIRPTEEETTSKNVLDLYDALCDYLTLPWLLVELGAAMSAYFKENFTDSAYLHYIDRCIKKVSLEIGERSNYNLNIY